MGRNNDGGRQLRHRPSRISDVARAAGVSTATVSRTLSAPDKVSEKTRQSVLRAIEQTGYRVNIAARNLRRRQTGAIAVLVPDLANPFFASILSGVAEVMAEAGMNVLVNDTTPIARDRHQFPDYANAQHVDGLIVLDGLLDTRSLQALGPPDTRPPVVFACEWSETLDRARVTIDNEAAARGAVAYLLGLGHVRIGHLGGPPANVLTKARLRGAKAAVAAAGLAIRPEWIYPGDFSLESGTAAARAWCAASSRPTAVFCASDVMAIGFIGELMRRGIRVPEAVSVVGFDDVEMAAHFVPSLTTVHQPRREIGRVAATMLCERLAMSPAERNAEPPPKLTLKTELAIRESTAPPPQDS